MQKGGAGTPTICAYCRLALNEGVGLRRDNEDDQRCGCAWRCALRLGGFGGFTSFSAHLILFRANALGKGPGITDITTNDHSHLGTCDELYGRRR